MKPKKKVKIKQKAATNDEIKKAVGKKISELRKKRGHSSLRVAEQLNISREALSHIETGRNNISAVSLWKLACIFNCNISDFFPKVPEGYSLSKLSREDEHLLAQDDERAVEWAQKLFGEKE